ncbi:MAG: hypothetical protein ABSH51_17980 [Solirubrobacteraceae bacterium]|jgi:hypothetical protein
MDPIEPIAAQVSTLPPVMPTPRTAALRRDGRPGGKDSPPDRRRSDGHDDPDRGDMHDGDDGHPHVDVIV